MPRALANEMISQLYVIDYNGSTVKKNTFSLTLCQSDALYANVANNVIGRFLYFIDIIKMKWNDIVFFKWFKISF